MNYKPTAKYKWYAGDVFREIEVEFDIDDGKKPYLFVVHVSKLNVIEGI